MKEEGQYGDQPVLEGDTAIFEASSDFSLDHAIHQAAEDAQAYYEDQRREKRGRKKKIYLEIVRQEVAIGNPHISEYRVRITGPGGTG